MILGIDLGTSMVKAVCFSMEGVCLATASRRTTLNHLGEGRIEQDFEAIVTSVWEMVAEVCAGCRETPRAIGITRQSDGLWRLDAEDRAAHPAIS